MTFNVLIVLCSIVTGAIGLIGGLIFKKNPPKTINWWYGYRTKRSMENQEKWDFAQKVAAQHMILYSSIPFLTSVLGFFIDEDNIGLSIGVVTASTFLWLILSIFKTEKKLKLKEMTSDKVKLNQSITSDDQ